MLREGPLQPRRGKTLPIAAGLLLCLLPFAGGRRTLRSLGLFVLLTAVIFLPLSGCGGSPSSSGTTTTTTSNPSGGTPTGSSQFTIVGATASISTAHSAALTITVTN